MAIIRSLCGQCSVGCGVRAITGKGRDLLIEGDLVHPANGGRLCDRGMALGQMAALDGRLLRPMVAGRSVGWDRAIAHVARRLTAIMARHGPGSVAMHVSGGLLTEDYYVANKLMKGFLGSAHIQSPWSGGDGVGTLQRAALGEDVMPATMEDIDRARTVMLVGAQVGLDHLVLMDRIQAARDEQGLRFILLTDRDDEDGIDADLRLRVSPGSMDRLLTGAMLYCRAGDGAAGCVTPPGRGWDAIALDHDLWSVARACALPPAVIRSFYEEIAATDQLVTVFGAESGGRAGAAAINLHLATGRIGRPGAAPFAVTDSPNGMGAREVGCGADQLAAHQGFTADALSDVARFWGARQIARGTGLQGEALRNAMRGGQVKAFWAIGSGGEALDWLGEARAARMFTIAHADRADGLDDVDMLFPSPVWIERDGTATASDRLISRQRHLLPLPGEVRPDWWTLTRVGQAMGWGDAFHYERPADIYREHVRLTAYRNDGGRLLNLKRHAPISNPAYDELTPWRWGDVPFDGGHFPTADGRARLIWPLDQPLAAIP